MAANKWVKLSKTSEAGMDPSSEESKPNNLQSVDLEAPPLDSVRGGEASAQSTKNSSSSNKSSGADATKASTSRKLPGGWKQAQWWDTIAFWPHPLCNTLSVASGISVLVLANLLILVAVERGSSEPLGRVGTTEGGPAVEADIGVVAADEGRCSQMGIGILKAGGNAVDSAVAVALCLGVLNPMASGVGGGHFMLLRMANGSAELIDCRETAPAAASEDMFSNNNVSSTKGGRAIAVPGELAGLHLAWQRHGRMPWAMLVQPSAQLAVEGFLVSKYLAVAIQEGATDILADPNLSAVFAPGGILLRAGDKCYRQKLGETLFQVAEQGPSVLYGGALGQALAGDVQAAGGLITAEDMAGFRPVVRDPLLGAQMGLTVLGAPPPSSGGAAIIEVLKILAGYPLPLAAAGALGLHRTIEALKHAFALRMNLGDPAFVDAAPVLADMLSDEFASALRANISDTTTQPPEFYGGKWNQLADHGTSHFSIVDGDRNAVAVTSTVNLGFGARVLSPATGILLNDEMDDFSIPGEPNIFGLPPSEANFIRPGKRPLSSMSPTIVLQNGQLRAVVGGSGGPYIITATVQVLLNYFARGLSALEAVQAPRVHHQLVPNKVFYEANHSLLSGGTVSLPEELVAALVRRGHEVAPIPYGGVVQLIVHDLEVPATNRSDLVWERPQENVMYGKLTAVSDPRKDGQAAGW